MVKKQRPTIIEMTEEELNALRERIKKKQLIEDDYPIVEQTIQFVVWVQIKLEHAKISMSKLKKLLFGSKTEKKNRSKNNADDSKKKELDGQSTNEAFDKPESEKQEDTNLAANQDMSNTVAPLNMPDDFKTKHKSHGKIPASEYAPYEVIVLSHEILKSGDNCPGGCGGRLYPLREVLLA